MLNTLVTKKLLKSLDDKEFSLHYAELRKLFAKLIDVENFSRAFVEKLHTTIIANKNTKNIAEAFDGLKQLVDVYFEYIYAYHSNMPNIKTERTKNAAFSKLVEYFETNAKDTIEAFLITPVQRPPRYRLLLQELIKYTPKETQEYTDLNKYLQEIMQAIASVDDKIDVFDEYNKMCQLQSSVSDFDIIGVKGRRMYFQGPATKFSRKYTNNRYLAIFNDGLLVLESYMVINWKPNKFYKTGEYLIMDVADSPPFVNAIDVRQKDKSFRCNLEDSKAKVEFLQGFEKMMKANNLTRADLEVRGFAPVWIPDDQAPVCMECQKKFTLFFRRHHCRRCGKCICSDCFKNQIRIPGISESPKHVCNECYKELISRETELLEALTKRGPSQEQEKADDIDEDVPFVSALDQDSD